MNQAASSKNGSKDNSTPTNSRTQAAGGQDAAKGLTSSSTDPQYEPKTTYNPQYPYNKVMTTESGHVLEVDDTPGASRLRLYHKSGSYVEISDDGRIVSKCVGSAYEVVQNDHSMMVSGSCTMTVNGNVNMNVNGNMTQKVNGDFTHQIGGSYNLKASSATFNAGSVDFTSS